MSLINYPGSFHQMAVIELDAGYARDITLMLTDAHALAAGLASGDAPAAARQAAAVLRDADSAYTLDALAAAEVINWLYQARDHALAGNTRVLLKPGRSRRKVPRWPTAVAGLRPTRGQWRGGS